MIGSKKCFGIFCMLLFIAFASCSKRNVDVHRASTLHEEAVILESRTSWANEPSVQPIEYESPNADVDEDPVLILLSQECEDTHGNRSASLQYPSLPNFPELDTTAFSAAQKDAITDFCRALVQNAPIDRYVMNDSLYTIVLFKYNLGKENLSVKDITDYVLGKPFINEKECQCPVRLFLNDGTHLDVNVYLARSGQNWKIQQIEYKAREITK
ncbi:MAG: hypothetical protein IJ828_05135 [Treponema sp.]|nr:hypothetical protein [Treponema sp.]